MSRWPFPGDLPVDRARQVAQQYREALTVCDPDTCRVLDSMARAVGEDWVVGQPAIEDEADLVTVARAAELVGRSKRWVYLMVATGQLPATARRPTKILLSDLREAAAQRRRQAEVSGTSSAPASGHGHH